MGQHKKRATSTKQTPEDVGRSAEKQTAIRACEPLHYDCCVFAFGFSLECASPLVMPVPVPQQGWHELPDEQELHSPYAVTFPANLL